MSHEPDNHEGQGGIAEQTRDKVEPPKRYAVLLHNDHFTTMEFVIEILMTIFHKSEQEAFEITLAVHHEEVGVAGVYTSEIAETKVAEVHAQARAAGFPLRCSMEEEE